VDDPEAKVAPAREAVERLRHYFEPYEAELLEEEQNKARIEKVRAEAELTRATSKRLAQLHDRFNELMGMDNPQRRGFDFESFLKELFDTFDLDPKASFKVEGEQIDGGFTLSGTHFLLEARWRQDLTDREALDGFAAKVHDKAENTLGLFISMAGFEPGAGLDSGSETHGEAVSASTHGRRRGAGGSGRADRSRRVAEPEAPSRKHDRRDLPPSG